MKQRIPTIDEQIVGILTGRWPSDAHDFSDYPATKFSVKVGDLKAYFSRNASTAELYLKKFSATRPPNEFHDIVAIWKDGDVYRVAWLDHGSPIDVRSFSSINDAVIDHICQKTGIRA